MIAILRRAFPIAGIVATLVLGVSTAAFAHTEFDPEEAAPGSIITLSLFVENESSTAGTTIIELRFPQPLVIVELPTLEGWTVAPVEGTLGGEAIGVLWSRDTADPGEDPNLPLTIGPLPAGEGRLQFKVVQTYSDGRIDRWIEDWPAGTPEPQQPGPILDLVTGAPGTIPDTTVAVTTTIAPATTAAPAAPATTAIATATSSTAATTSPTSAPDQTTPPTIAAPDDDSSSTGPIIAIAAALAIVIAAVAVVLRRRKR